MARYRLSFGLVLAVAALSLAACGRKGSLELPPGPATEPPVAAAPASPLPSSFMPNSGTSGTTTPQQEDAAAVKNGFDSHGNPVATPSTKKSFILDPILQ